MTDQEIDQLFSMHGGFVDSMGFHCFNDAHTIYRFANAISTKNSDGYKEMFQSAVSALAEIDKLLGLPEDGCNDTQVTVSALADLIAGLKDISSRAIPEGYVVVPKVLTQEMAEAMKQSIVNAKHTDGVMFNFQDEWDAAIAAAPANKEGA